MVKQKREKRVVGWKEYAALPDLNVKSVIAKIDTGATLASIDAADITLLTLRSGKAACSFHPTTLFSRFCFTIIKGLRKTKVH